MRARHRIAVYRAATACGRRRVNLTARRPTRPPLWDYQKIMPSEPTWFGPSDRPLAGWLHTPEGATARGGVLICPPLGLEYVNSHRALRRLSETAATLGFVALRFDYDGTGDSAGTLADPDRVDAWRGSVRAAIDLLRSTVGVAPLAVVGLRLGLTLAADVVTADEVDLMAMVAWDPAPSGRRFFRELSALGRFSDAEPSVDGSVDAPGFYFDADTVAAADELDLSRITRPPAAKILLLHRAESNPNVARLGAIGENATVEAVKGQLEFLDVPSPQSLLPTDTLDTITAWLDCQFPSERFPYVVRPKVDADIRASDGNTVTERFLRVGPLGLIAVETTPPIGAPTRSVLLLNNAVEHHVGPVRLWTETARAWASTGARVVRIDLSGIGDSPNRPGGAEDIMYDRSAISDVAEFVHHLGLEPAELTLVGLCSGAHLAVQAGAALGVSAVVAVNPVTTELLAPFPAGPTVVFGPRLRWPRKVLGALKLHDAARVVAKGGRNVLPRIPAALWRLAVGGRVVRSPAAGLLALANTDTRLLLVCGPEDSYGYRTRGKADLQELQRTSSIRLIWVDDLAHVPMARRQRVLVTQIMTDFLHEA